MPYHHGREIRHYYRLNRSPFLPGFQIHKKGIWEGASWKVLHNSWISGRSLERKKERVTGSCLPTFLTGFPTHTEPTLALWPKTNLLTERSACFLREQGTDFRLKLQLILKRGILPFVSCLLNKSPIRSWVHNRWWSYISFRCLKYSYTVNQ